MRHFANDVKFFDVGLIDLVHNVDALAVLSVSFNDVDEVIWGSVTSEVDVGVGDSVFMADGLDKIVVEERSLQKMSSGDVETTLLLPLEDDVWWGLVKPDTETFQFSLDDPLVSHWLHDIENDENKVASSCDTDDLFTSTFTILSSFNNTREIEKLDCGSLVLVDTRDACQCCKLVIG